MRIITQDEILSKTNSSKYALGETYFLPRGVKILNYSGRELALPIAVKALCTSIDEIGYTFTIKSGHHNGTIISILKD